MQYRASLLLVAACSLIATSAAAAPVFLLQFGSFEERTEAEARLSQLKTKHAGVFAKLDTGVREVTLPPDNLKVYRTQAGPLPTRADAQSVCSQLASNGDECYVVETAMVASAGTPAPAAAPVAPAPATMKTAAAPAPTAAPTPAGMLAAPQEVPPPGADAAEGVVIAMDAPKPQAKAEAEAANDAQPATKVRAERSFWSRMNPFGDDEAEGEYEVTEADDSVKLSAPPLRSPEPLVATAPEPKPLPAPVASSPTTVQFAQAAPAVAPGSVTPVLNTPPPMNLPPPPAPLRAQDVAAVNAIRATPAPLTPPQSTGSVPLPVIPAPVVTAAPVPVPAAVPTPVTPADGNVSVAEAQRVPLTTATQPAPAPSAIAGMQQPVQAVSLLPSSTLGHKTLWAHIGQFADARSALAFWNEYRQAHPDFPVVRVRVTTPYQGVTRGIYKVSLRVGPFVRNDTIKNLCTNVTNPPEDDAKEYDLRCGTIQDLGVAENPYAAASRGGFLAGSRYQR